MQIGAAIPICEKDAHYLPVLLPEIERMQVDVAWLANNCSEETIEKLASFSRTVAVEVYDGIFHNSLRQYPLDELKAKGYDWCIQWDADETWEELAPQKLTDLLTTQQLVQVRMAHVWEKDGKNYVTTDWAAERDRIYNLKYNWFYTSRVIAGATLLDEPVITTPLDIWMLHWGYATAERRAYHKTRWDRIHGNSAGKNPYGMWDTITQEGYEPKLLDFDDYYKA